MWVGGRGRDPVGGLNGSSRRVEDSLIVVGYGAASTLHRENLGEHYRGKQPQQRSEGNWKQRCKVR